MKKLLILALLLMLTSCQTEEVAAPIDTSSWQSYENNYYRFSLRFPTSLTYCLNEYCFNEIPEDVMTAFLLRDGSGDVLLQMQVYKNDLDTSAAEYGEKSLSLARENSLTENVYFEEGADLLDGQESFSFLAEKGFEEWGGVTGTTEDGHVSIQNQNPPSDESPLISLSLSGTFKVIYTEYDGYFYRILYSDTEEMNAVMDSFQFLDEAAVSI